MQLKETKDKFGNMIYQKITPGIVTVPLNNGVDSNSRMYNKISNNN